MASNQASQIYPAPSGKQHTIGRVIEILKPDFPDLSPSKIRFLEEQGLVSPFRTASGYRKYSDQHIERVRLVLELQRDKFLPHKVIRSYLEDLDAGKQPVLPSETRRPSVNTKFKKIELIAETGINETLLAEAQLHKLIGSEPFKFSDIEIARALMSLQRFGIAPRHLRGIKTAADRDLGLIQGVIATIKKQRDPAAKSRAAQYANEIEADFALIRSEIIRSVIDLID